MSCLDTASLDDSELLSEEQLQSWRQNGWLLVRGIWPEDLITQCQAPAISEGSVRFPHCHDLLNHVPLHPKLLRIARQILAEKEHHLRLVQSDIRCKEAYVFSCVRQNPAEQNRSYSSVWGDDSIGSGHARSMLDSAQCWSAKKNQVGEWMQFDLGCQVHVSGIVVQGRGDWAKNQFVTKYTVRYSADGTNWRDIPGEFDGARPDQHVESFFPEPVSACCIRLVVQAWESHISMRAAILQYVPGAQFVNPREALRSYSSIWGKDVPGTGHAQSMLDSSQAWSAARNEVGEWMQMDLGLLVQVLGMVVQRRGDEASDQCVTKYRVMYSSNGLTWENLPGESTVPYTHSASISLFTSPISARYIRIVVLEWENHISMRAAALVSADEPCSSISDSQDVWESCERCRLAPTPVAEPDALSIVLSYTGHAGSHGPTMFIGSAGEPVSTCCDNEISGGRIAIPHSAGTALLARLETRFRVAPLLPGQQHCFHHMVLRRSHAEWVQSDAFVRRLENQQRLLAGLTPEQRSVLGFPAPGHTYWLSREKIDLAEKRIGLDPTPYLAAAAAAAADDAEQLPEELCPPQQSVPDPPVGALAEDPRQTYAESARLVLPEPAAGLGLEVLSIQQVKQWHEEGWLHIGDIWPQELIERAAASSGSQKFPCAEPALNEIVLHSRYLNVVSQLLGVPVASTRLTFAMNVRKVGPSSEVLQAAEWPTWANSYATGNQPMHQDFGNNTLLTPSRCMESWSSPEDVVGVLYLNDCEEVGGGTCFVPGLRHSASGEDLYKAERRVAYAKGSVIIYTIGTWHRGTPVNPGKTRHVMFLGYRTASAEWVGGSSEVGAPSAVAFADLSENHDDFDMLDFLGKLSPDQRSVLGFPAIGSHYWTSEAVEAVQKRFGEALDVEPYVRHSVSD